MEVPKGGYGFGFEALLEEVLLARNSCAVVVVYIPSLPLFDCLSLINIGNVLIGCGMLSEMSPLNFLWHGYFAFDALSAEFESSPLELDDRVPLELSLSTVPLPCLP